MNNPIVYIRRMLLRAGQTLTGLRLARDSGIPLYRLIPHKIVSRILRIFGDYGPFSRKRSYSTWIAKYDTMDDNARARLSGYFNQLSTSGEELPLISLVMPTYNTPELYLTKAIESVLDQVYENWELCIADDASTKPHVRRILEQYGLKEKRVKLCFREENGHISAASNSALEMATGRYVALLDHDDMLSPYGLAAVALEVRDHPDAAIIYSDEDRIDESGKRSHPYFKPDFDPELILGQNYLSHCVFATDAIRSVGGFRIGYEGSQDWDLVLRVLETATPTQIRHIPHVLYHWRAHMESTAGGMAAKPYAADAAKKAVEDHLQRTGQEAEVIPLPLVLGNRIRYQLPATLPLVSIIIPTRDGKLLQTCVDSVIQKTAYKTFEIVIVDNGSIQPSTLSYLSSLVDRWGTTGKGNDGSEMGSGRGSTGEGCIEIGSLEQRDRLSGLQVVRMDIPFNYSILNNAGVAHANGELICLLNDDIEITNPDWLTEMVRHAIRPEVGVVGAKLLYPNGNIQHGGVILGLSGGGAADHASRHTPSYSPGYFGRAALTQSFSAVTGACLLTKRDPYNQIGGLDEEHLPVSFNDVDFCLRLKANGYRIVWEPAAVLVHHESTSRGRDDNFKKAARVRKEVAWIQQQWGALIRNDPAYNPNLSLDTADFSLAWPPRVEPVWEGCNEMSLIT